MKFQVLSEMILQKETIRFTREIDYTHNVPHYIYAYTDSYVHLDANLHTDRCVHIKSVITEGRKQRLPGRSESNNALTCVLCRRDKVFFPDGVTIFSVGSGNIALYMVSIFILSLITTSIATYFGKGCER